MKQSLFTITTYMGEYTIFYHTLTQALAAAPTSELENPSLSNQLFCLGFYVADDKDETVQLSARYQKDIQTTESLCFEIAPTLECNLACPYCYEREVKRTGVMSAEMQHLVAEFIINQARTLASRRVKIGWYGGEPTLGISAIEGITSLVRDAGVPLTATMISNCALITPELAQRIAAYGITEVTATLDGVGARHDRHRPSKNGESSYQAILDGLAALRQAGVQAHCIFNEDRGNSREYEQVNAALLSTCGITAVASQIFDYCHCLDCVDDFTRKDYDIFEDPREFALKQYARFQATHPKDEDYAQFMTPMRLFCSRQVDTYCVIDERGNIYECDGDIGYTDRITGHVKDGVIPAHKPYSPYEDPLCAECAFTPICLGNCRWTRDYIGQSCTPQKVIIDEILQDWAALHELEETAEVQVLRPPTSVDWDEPLRYDLW